MPPNQTIARKRPSGAAQAAPGVTAPAGATQAHGGAAPKAGAPAAPAPQGAAQTAQPAAGTGFVNLSRVLEANRGGGQRMGQQIIQGAQAKGQAAQQATQAAQGAFTAASASKVLQYDPNAVKGGYDTAWKDYEANKPPNQQGWNYTEQPGYKAYVDSANEGIAKGKALAGTTYEGPKDWEGAGINVAGLSAEAQRAQEEAAALGTNSGRSALLSRQFSGPRSSGASALDAALVNDAVGGQAQDVASQFSGLTDTLAKARGTAGASYDANKAASDANAAKYGADAAALEATQKQNRELQESANQNRQWNSESKGPQMSVPLPMPKPGGGMTFPVAPNPNNTPTQPTTWPAPTQPAAPPVENSWGRLARLMRRP